MEPDSHGAVENELEAARERVRRLEAVVEASALVNSTLDLKPLAEHVVATACRLVGAERGSLFVIDGSRETLTSLVATGVDGDSLRLRIGEGIVGTVAATGEPINIADPYADPRFDRRIDVTTGFRTRSLLTVPVHDRDGTLVAVLQLLNHCRGSFSADDVAFLRELGVAFAIALLAARLHAEIVARERAAEELRLAAEIQHALRPADLSGVEGLDLSVLVRPCLEVGGDHYDLIPTERDSWWLAVADVSGKGVPAGLIASNIQAFLWSRRSDPRPLATIVREGNELLYRLAQGRKYATMMVAEWQPSRRRLTWVNAGHPPALLRRGDHVERLGATGLPLGLLPGYDYTEDSRDLAVDDVLLICTDGVLEAGLDSGGDEFGEQRLESCLLAERVTTAVLSRVEDELERHLDSAAPGDDITLLCARVTDPEETS